MLKRKENRIQNQHHFKIPDTPLPLCAHACTSPLLPPEPMHAQARWDNRSGKKRGEEDKAERQLTVTGGWHVLTWRVDFKPPEQSVSALPPTLSPHECHRKCCTGRASPTRLAMSVSVTDNSVRHLRAEYLLHHSAPNSLPSMTLFPPL